MSHIYTLDGIDYPSVTTIIKLISGNEALMIWSNYLGFKRKDFKDVMNQYSIHGTKIHLFMQKLLDPNLSEEERVFDFKNPLEKYEFTNILKAFRKEFENVNFEVIETEKTIVSANLKYGGTLDLIIKIDDKLVLADYKTSKAARHPMMLQLGGYYNLLKEIGIDVEYAMIILLNETKCKRYILSKERLIAFGEAFLDLYKFYLAWENLQSIDLNSLIERTKK